MLFSILTTCYNQDKTIKDTIKSCLNQTFDDYEIVISDDGSTDNSHAIIESFSNPKIRFFKQEKNLKEYPNRNFLVENAKGQYVIFIDGEDLIYPHALEIFAYYLNLFPGSGMIVTRAIDHRLIFPLKLYPKDIYRFDFLDRGILGENFTNVLFKKESLVNAGLFPSNIKSGDTYIQLKIALTEPAVVIGDGLTWWRCSTGNVTKKLDPQYSAKDYCHLASTINYRIEMLDNENCPLDKYENEKAKINMYGTCLRIVLRWLITFKFGKIYYLFKSIRIPKKYLPSVFIRSKYNYFAEYNLDNPMKIII